MVFCRCVLMNRAMDLLGVVGVRGERVGVGCRGTMIWSGRTKAKGKAEVRALGVYLYMYEIFVRSFLYFIVF